MIGAALAIDWLYGEPPNALHPVVWLGTLIARLERNAPREQPRHELLYGAGMAAASIAAALLPALLLSKVASSKDSARVLPADRARVLIGTLLSVYLLKTTFAWRTLFAAGKRVQLALEADDSAAARAALRWLVSRDTSDLSDALVAAATIESLAENASDSVIAPLFYYALFGLPGACAYRAVNTLDAMIGYRGRYEYLGKLPARLDDLLNLVPARLTALLLLAAAPLAGGDLRGAALAWWHDRSQTASPNAGHPMSAMAGALGLRLEKVGHYQLNAAGREPSAVDIRRALRMVNIALGLAVGLVLLARR